MKSSEHEWVHNADCKVIHRNLVADMAVQTVTTPIRAAANDEATIVDIRPGVPGGGIGQSRLAHVQPRIAAPSLLERLVPATAFAVGPHQQGTNDAGAS